MQLDFENIEKLVATFSSLGEKLESVLKLMEAFSRILDKEEAAVRVSDINQIEETVKRKEEIGRLIEQDIQSIRKGIFDVCIISSPCEKADQETCDLSQLIDATEKIDSALSDKNFASQVLIHLTAKVTENSRRVIRFRVELQPKVEANGYLVRRLLVHHQETYRFWQSLISEAESVYGAMGKTKAAQSQSMLEVKT